MVLLLSCARSASSVGFDAGVEIAVAVVDGGFGLTPRALDAWLSWQGAMADRSRMTDGGHSREAAKRRARLEAQRLADAGLTFEDVDRIEAVVAVAVTEWNIERLAGSGEGRRFGAALVGLSEAQRAKAEAALGGSVAPRSSLPLLEARFGVDTMRALTAREAEIIRAWDALTDSTGEGR